MERKKKVLLELLEKLGVYWDMAEGLKAFVESEYVQEKDIDNILKFLQSRVKKTREKIHKNKVVNMKKKIIEAEEKEKKGLEDIEKLLDTIEL